MALAVAVLAPLLAGKEDTRSEALVLGTPVATAKLVRTYNGQASKQLSFPVINHCFLRFAYVAHVNSSLPGNFWWARCGHVNKVERVELTPHWLLTVFVRAEKLTCKSGV